MGKIGDNCSVCAYWIKGGDDSPEWGLCMGGEWNKKRTRFDFVCLDFQEKLAREKDAQ